MTEDIATAGVLELSGIDESGVLIATMDNPPANAMNRALIRGLTELFVDLASGTDAPAVVLTGRGDRFFTAGGDIKELEGAEASELDGRMRDFHALLTALDRYPRPVVGAVNGHCVGGGMELALFTDGVLAVDHARFGFPEINHGLLPADKGIQRAVKLLGAHTARNLLLTGEIFGIRRAVDIGLVERVVEPDRLLTVAVERARTLAAKPAVLYAALKWSVNKPVDEDDGESLRATLSAAENYFDDPAAAAARARWSGRRDR
ncbi:enoyl-CoA hydratase/isomerase family protein [Gordonia humi]|uniref:Enoyl-CoA hydratase/carnithine racemase n=1 Tax=Gordonia humi TaxID=686429 RepID=A0A840EUK5_9ACTN|nr:enoyl-CoA hydratase/isomerase family protein [Gordonia humi]MBB4133983.1 enoyl-CoA hydratase/carnithine racemase [Gordonia humi]